MSWSILEMIGELRQVGHDLAAKEDANAVIKVKHVEMFWIAAKVLSDHVSLLHERDTIKSELATLRTRAEKAEAEHGDRAAERDSAYYSIDQIAEALNVDMAAGDGSLSPVMEKIKELNAIATAAHAWRTARIRCFNSNSIDNVNAFANATTALMAALDGARGGSK